MKNKIPLKNCSASYKSSLLMLKILLLFNLPIIIQVHGECTHGVYGVSNSSLTPTYF